MHALVDYPELRYVLGLQEQGHGLIETLLYAP